MHKHTYGYIHVWREMGWVRFSLCRKCMQELLRRRRYEPTCVCQVNDAEKNHSSRQRDSQEEHSLELLLGESVLQVLQEGVDLQQHEHSCRDTLSFVENIFVTQIRK